MSEQHKTSEPCDCGWLAMAMNDERKTVTYDPVSHVLILDGGYVMYHCPFCGGCYPDSSKAFWVPLVPAGERERLESMISRLDTVDAIVNALGKPDFDAATTSYRWKDGVAEEDESMEPTRNIEYYGLSDWLNVEFYCSPDTGVHYKIAVKLQSPRNLD